jgi:hypothetical protein
MSNPPVLEWTPSPTLLGPLYQLFHYRVNTGPMDTDFETQYKDGNGLVIFVQVEGL